MSDLLFRIAGMPPRDERKLTFEYFHRCKNKYYRRWVVRAMTPLQLINVWDNQDNCRWLLHDNGKVYKVTSFNLIPASPDHKIAIVITIEPEELSVTRIWEIKNYE